VRGAGRFGVGGSSGGGVHRYSHRAVQLEEEQNKSEHRAARCVCGRHSYLHEVLLGRKRGSSVLTTRGSESESLVCAFCLARFHVSEQAQLHPSSRGASALWGNAKAWFPSELAFRTSFFSDPFFIGEKSLSCRVPCRATQRSPLTFAILKRREIAESRGGRQGVRVEVRTVQEPLRLLLLLLPTTRLEARPLPCRPVPGAPDGMQPRPHTIGVECVSLSRQCAQTRAAPPPTASATMVDPDRIGSGTRINLAPLAPTASTAQRTLVDLPARQFRAFPRFRRPHPLSRQPAGIYSAFITTQGAT